jgi:tetratricopeptide (TPR) repeat protein
VRGRPHTQRHLHKAPACRRRKRGRQRWQRHGAAARHGALGPAPHPPGQRSATATAAAAAAAARGPQRPGRAVRFYSTADVPLPSPPLAPPPAAARFKEAALECTSALELAPANPKALQRRARALEQQGQYKQALSDIEAVNR